MQTNSGLCWQTISRILAIHTTSDPCEGNAMNLSLTPVISLLAGILILIQPKLLNYIVAIYLIIIGVVGIFGIGNITFS
jgi:threonine/homoserine efflux transporter RhtA